MSDIPGYIPVAETVGFEPTEGFNTLTVLAGPRTRPDYATSPITEHQTTGTLPGQAKRGHEAHDDPVIERSGRYAS